MDVGNVYSSSSIEILFFVECKERVRIIPWLRSVVASLAPRRLGFNSRCAEDKVTAPSPFACADVPPPPLTLFQGTQFRLAEFFKKLTESK